MSYDCDYLGDFTQTGSLTDLLSNRTVFAPIDLRLHLKPIADGLLPPELLGVFLHEVTHFTCFLSPLGTALFALKMRIMIEAYAISETGDKRALTTFISDYMAFVAAREVLRPLAEGLALFAQFDAWSLTDIPFADTIAMTLMYARQVPAHAGLTNDANTFRWFLQLCRQVKVNVESKAELLAEPMSGPQRAYILGYLLLKAAWLQYHKYSRQTSDGDKFLGYACTHLFFDLELVDCLLDDSGPTVSGRIRRITQHVDRRARELFSENVPGKTRELVQRIMSEAHLDPIPKLASGGKFAEEDIPFIPEVNESREAAQAGRRRLANLLTNLAPKDAKDALPDIPTQIRLLFSSILGHRQYLCLGVTEAEVLVKDGRVQAFEKGVERAGGKAVPGISPGAGPGWIEVHELRFPPQSVLTIYRGNQLACSSIKHIGGYDLRPQFLRKPPEEALTQLLRLLEKPVREIAGSLEAAGTLVKSGSKIFSDVTLDHLQSFVYERLGFDSKIAKELAAHGFGNILGDSILDFARISVVAQTLTEKSEVSDALSGEGLKLTEMLRKTDVIQKRWNCNLIWHDSQAMMCLV